MLQVCYVVVGAGWDRHAQMAWLSAYSLRLQEPAARIVVVLEGLSDEANRVVESRFSGLAEEVLCRRSTLESPVAKNRFHRIALREYLSGDFLYLDSDTLVIAPLGDVMQCPADVGAVPDFNHDPADPWFPPELEQPFRSLGWTYPLQHYLNSGVILLRDTPKCRAFCAEWLRRWQAPNALPHFWDQATFNSALFASDVHHAVLPNGYNAMVVKRNYRFRQSKILHFFGSPDEQRGTLLAHLLEYLQREGSFDRVAYDRCLRQGHPWGPRPEPWQLRRSRNYFRATMAVPARALRRLWTGGSSRRRPTQGR